MLRRAGTAVFAGMEGTRPVLVEFQALVAPTSLGMPRRAVVGWDSSRLAMVLAVLEAHAGVRLGGHDVYLNVAGGLKISEPAADLAAAAALVSSLTGAHLPANTVYFGEIGLSGSIRPVDAFAGSLEGGGQARVFGRGRPSGRRRRQWPRRLRHDTYFSARGRHRRRGAPRRRSPASKCCPSLNSNGELHHAADDVRTIPSRFRTWSRGAGIHSRQGPILCRGQKGRRCRSGAGPPLSRHAAAFRPGATGDRFGQGGRRAPVRHRKPELPDTETSFAELRDRVAKTLDFIRSVPAAAIDGAEERVVELKAGQTLTFKGRDYLLGFALPNFYFHVTTAYAILRHNGVEIGKLDYLGQVPMLSRA